MSDTFCILPWIHMYANADGSVIPCCIANHHKHLGNLHNDTIHEIWNNESYKRIRKNMIDGIRNEECQACFFSEDNNVKSFRQSINEGFEHYIHLKEKTNPDGSLDEMHLRYFDIRWSNICNLRCRSCSPTYSSSWAKESGNKNVYILAGGENNNSLYDQFEPFFEDIEIFYFAGGEPLMTDKHYDILNYLINNKNTKSVIRYNTNLSVLSYKDQNVLDLWKKFENVEVSVSLDSWADKAEYIRDGCNWKQIEQNIKRIKNDCPHVKLQISTVVSVFNIFTLPEFYNYLINSKLFERDVDINLYCIQNPDIYTFSVFNDNFKNKIRNKFYDFDTDQGFKNKLQDVLKTLESKKYNNYLHTRFIDTTKFYDNKRQQNFCKTFPELNEIWID